MSLGFFSLPLWAEVQSTEIHMTAWQAVILGVVEGLTEYLPVSSTGHLILAEHALGLTKDPSTKAAADSYTIVIQLGAIFAVLGVYFSYFISMLKGVFGKDSEGLKLLRNLIISFIPAAIVGILFVGAIKHYLFGLWPTMIAWFIGGIALIIWGDRSKDRPGARSLEMKDLTVKTAFIIGLLQTIAVWPGTSRSLVTILGGRLVGLRLRDAVIYSFLLGMLTLSASTFYDLLNDGAHMIDVFGTQNILIGIFTAWISAWLAVKGMVTYLKKHGLKLFGGYRVALAIITAFLMYMGFLDNAWT